MPRNRNDEEKPLLFNDLPPKSEPKPEVKRLRYPIWTNHKAKLIARYLYHFVLVTRHGTYIDGFAGPQQSEEPDMWAAKLVLESEPRWLKRFYLFDIDPTRVACL